MRIWAKMRVDPWIVLIIQCIWIDPNETGCSKVIVKGQKKTCIGKVVKKKEG